MSKPATSGEAEGGASTANAEPPGRVPRSARGVPRSRKPRSTSVGTAMAGLTAGIVLAGLTAGIVVAVSGFHSGPHFTGAADANVANVGAATMTPSPRGASEPMGAVPGPMPGAPSSHARATVPTSPPTPLAAAQPTAPKPLRPTNPGLVAKWKAGQGGKMLARVTTLVGTVLMANGTGQYGDMLQACESLAGSVRSASTLPPIPDAAMQSEYLLSLGIFKTATAVCKAGITQHEEVENVVPQVNQAVIRPMVSRLRTGVVDLYIATDYLRVIF